jgi:putative membrane protein
MSPAAASRSATAATAAAGLTLAGMIATPLARRGGAVRRVLSSVVVCGLATTTGLVAARRWGPGRAAAAAGSVAVSTALVERIGTRTGWPFGGYGYAGVLRPEVGGVPAIVPAAWFAMAVPAREAAHAALGHRSSRATRIVLGAAALTAWDLFLDPQMVGEGYWSWRRRGRYRGIPLSNYVGWLLTGLGVMALLELTLPVDDAIGGSDAADPVLVAEYGVMAAMETLGFAVFFRDRLVAAVGGAGMLPVAVLAARRVLAQRHWRTGGARG